MTGAAAPDRTPASRRLRHVAGRAVGWAFESLGGPPPGLVRGGGDDGTPVVVVLLLEADAATTARTARSLVEAAPDAGSRPLLVMDQPHFTAARRAGVACDHLLSRDAWAERGHVAPWEEHVAAELRRLRRDFATERVVTLPSSGTDGLDPGAVRALLRPPADATGRPASGRVRAAVSRLERRIDRPSR